MRISVLNGSFAWLPLVLAGCAVHAPGKAAAPTATTGAPQKGVAVGGFDRQTDPCTDFYQFANGAWRAAHPIPASLPRWGRRAVARQLNQARLQSIVEEVSQRADWPPASTQQLIGDYYAACMDEARSDAAGLTPLTPLLHAIDRIRTAADVPRVVADLHALAIPVLFSVTGGLDNHEPTQFIANLAAGTLGLAKDATPEARDRYRAHIARVWGLTGMVAVEAHDAADIVVTLEARLAQASLDSAAAADSAATDHKMTFAELEQLTPRFDWTAYFDGARLPRAPLNVAEPKLLRQIDAEMSATSVAEWKIYLKWQLLDSASAWLSRPFVDEWLAYQGATATKARRRAAWNRPPRC